MSQNDIMIFRFDEKREEISDYNIFGKTSPIRFINEKINIVLEEKKWTKMQKSIFLKFYELDNRIFDEVIKDNRNKPDAYKYITTEDYPQSEGGRKYSRVLLRLDDNKTYYYRANNGLAYTVKHIHDFIKKICEINSEYALENFRIEYKNDRTNMEDRSNISVTEELENQIESGVKQIILTGAPGTGKTYLAKKMAEEHGNKLNGEAYKLVQFHPSYDYTDFVEGLRPVEIAGNVTFKKVDGIFKKFCRDVVEKRSDKDKVKPEPNKKYFFIIDEINRADLSKVFGELMYGLEGDKRGKENHFQTQYQNLFTYDIEEKNYIKDIENPERSEDTEDMRDVFKNHFYIPEEVYIIGTMNDIDRSVESMDFALRRRFNWIEVKANDELEQAFHNKFDSEEDREYILLPFIEEDRTEIVKKIIGKIKALNVHIDGEGEKYLLNRHYHISHGYFANLPENIVDAKDQINVKVEKILNYVWKYRLESLINEYVRGERDGDVFVGKCKENFILSMESGEEEIEDKDNEEQ